MNRSASKAFTLLEVLVAVILMVMLLSTLAFVFSQSVRAVTMPQHFRFPVYQGH